MEGTVKFFNRKKGFGFISGDDGKDYFVHFTGLTEGTFLRDNDRVSFESVEGERGPKAEKVTLLQKASEMEGGVAPAEESTPTTEESDEETSNQNEKDESVTEENEEAKEEPASEDSPEESEENKEA